ncbi:MAG: GNAT family N-acetyltransferase [Actinomycetota bacterium]|nr:GNAT family N-acetyltransferase [Actinomycetota bacterium]
MIRRGSALDVPFLRDMLHHAYYWRESDPEAGEPVSRYVANFGRRGDAALVAIEDHRRVGAAWYRLFPRDEPGFAFIDESTPEVSIAVVPSMRGRGIGSQLLSALIERAREEGYPALTLSVERDNPSITLYERHGFRPVHEDGDTVVMRADIQPRAAG